MSVENLKRVLQRVRAWYPDRSEITRSELQKAVMVECGTTRQTFFNNLEALLFLEWIKIKSPSRKRHEGIYILTGKDITEDF